MSLATWLRSDRGITTVSGKVSAWASPTIWTTTPAQGTAGNRPTYTNDGSGQNGQPFVDFVAASSTWLSVNGYVDWAAGSGTYMAVVCNITSTAGTQYLLDLTDSATTHYGRIVVADGSGNMYGRVVLGAVDENTGTAAATTGAQVIEVFRNSVTDKLELWRAGVRLSQSAAVATNTTGQTPSTISVGRNEAGTTNYFDGIVYEVIIGNVDPTNAQLAQLSCYFERRYRLKSCAKLTA